MNIRKLAKMERDSNRELYDELAQDEQPTRPKRDGSTSFIWKLTYPDGRVSYFFYGEDVAGQAERNDAELTITFW